VPPDQEFHSGMNDSPNNLLQLPKGWAWTTIAQICDLINGRAFKPKDWKTQGLPIVRIQNLNKADADFNYCDFKIDEKYYIDTGQLLFAWSGTPETSFGAHIWKRGRAVLNQHIFKVEINEKCLDKIFLMYLFNNNVSEYVKKAHGTAGLAHITKGKFDSSYVAISPLPEQQRIVAKIEELFSRLDAGVAALKQTKILLKRYRQSVLKAAVEGKLTEKWRKEHGDRIESASVLLEKIVSRQDAKGAKKRTMPPIDTSNLPAIPDSWVWANWGMILENSDNAFKRGPFGSSLTKSIFVKSGYKVYEQYCAINDDCSFGRYFITPEKFEEMKGFEVRAGDYLMSCSGVTLGRITRVPEKYEKGIINQALLRIRINERIIGHKYYLYLFRSTFFQKFLFDNSTGTAIPNVKGVKELKAIPIPLPPLPEQQQIVLEVKRRLSVADELEKTVETSLKQAERLRQSTLKRAFEGKLVQQDPNDPPAIELLERIKAEKGKD